jgi:hypothetical protein
MAHNLAFAGASALFIVVGVIVGALIIGPLNQRVSSQPVWSLTGPGVAIERPGTNGALRFAIQPTRPQQSAERFGVKSGFLEVAGDGTKSVAGARYLTRSRYAVKSGFLEDAGDGTTSTVTEPERAPHGFQP